MGRVWARLHFTDGGTLDLGPVSDWDIAAYEKGWREVGVRVEWLRSPRGRLDRALDVIVTQVVDNSTD